MRVRCASSLNTGDAVTVDRIFLATGYKPALARVPFMRSGDLLEHIATQNGSPVLDDAMQSTRPGLYFTSMLAAETFGPFFAFTLSARAAARAHRTRDHAPDRVTRAPLHLDDFLRRGDPLLDERVPLVAVRALPEQLGRAIPALQQT